MASQLPTIPRAVFTVIEPISLAAGFLGAIIDPDWFIAQQDPASLAVESASHNARIVALQLGNTYGLVCLIGLGVLYSTSETKVIRAYLIACLIADVSHVGITCWGLGYDKAMDYASWNAATWGNVGFTIFLGLTRTAYLLGLFGSGSSFPSSSSSSSSSSPAKNAITASKKVHVA